MIRIKCPKCEEILGVEDAQAGEIVSCTSCQARLRVPERRPAPSSSPPGPAVAPAAPKPSPEAVPEIVPEVESVEEDIPAVAPADDEDVLEADEPSSRGKGRFAVRPYKPDGGLSPVGLFLLPLFSLLAAFILGALASVIGQWFYLIVLFPIGIGFGVGLAGLLGVRLGKVRNVVLAGLVGLLAGFVAMLTYHFCDYLRLRSSLASLPPDVVRQMNDPGARFKAGGRPLPPGVTNEVRQAMGVTSFPGYLHHAATEGVTIGRAGRSGGGMNLGYIGTWIYWIVEVGIVAVISLLCCLGAAAAPFCRDCGSWKKEEKLGPIDMDPAEAKEAVETGRIDRLVVCDDLTNVQIKAHACPNCKKDADVELTLESVERSGKDQEKTSDLVQVTAAGAALGFLKRKFREAGEEAERERKRDRRRGRRDEDDEDDEDD